MPVKRTKPVRISLDLAPGTFQQVCDLEKRLAVGSKAAAIRQAIQVYHALAVRAGEGSKIVVRSAEGLERELLVPAVTP